MIRQYSDYFKNIIKPNVVQNGQQIAVPVIYGSPERWKSVQADGFYRDASGRLMVPLIMFKRENIDAESREYNETDFKRWKSLHGLRLLTRFSWRPFIKNKVRYSIKRKDIDLE